MQVHSPPATAEKKYYFNTSENRGSHMGKIGINTAGGGSP
jgi:hypothetical protein